jgi:hypothetical protein
LIDWNAPDTRDRIATGITTPKIAAMLISSTMTPNPLQKNAANSISSVTMPCPARARGTSASGTVNTRHPATYTSPAPRRDVSRLHSAEPRIPPTAPAPMTAPRIPGVTPRLRTA